jgi:hypothetical protein
LLFNYIDKGNVQEYRREVNKRNSGKLEGQIRDDPTMKPANYRCSSPGCGDRLLLGIRNAEHIVHAIKTLDRLGWSFDIDSQTMKCPDHRETSANG